MPVKTPPAVSETLGDTVFTGTVIWFNYKTGFGYIKPDAPIVIDGEEVNKDRDIFVHYSAISDNLALLRDGKPPFRKLVHDQKVKFNIGKNDKGYVALNVDKLEAEAPEAPEAEAEA